eukprot:scaffold36842_cov28-Tisochrysis_lutea.AAC.1
MPSCFSSWAHSGAGRIAASGASPLPQRGAVVSGGAERALRCAPIGAARARVPGGERADPPLRSGLSSIPAFSSLPLSPLSPHSLPHSCGRGADKATSSRWAV